MKKISLEDPLHVAYESVEPKVVGLKSAVINLYSDIDGYFIRRFGIKLGESVSDDDFEKIKPIFPRLAGMTTQMFNSLANTFADVRNINAHLYLCRKVALDREIEDYLNSIHLPLYRVTTDGYLTLFGQAYVGMFLCQKYNIWNFATSFFKKTLADFDGYDGGCLADFQVDFQHTYQEFCGIGKPIKNECPVPGIDVDFMNSLFKNHMTEFVLAIERMIYQSKKTYEHAFSFKNLVQKAFVYEEDDEAINRLVLMRNCWLHGTNLYDTIEYKGEKVCFDYQFVFESLIIIKKWMMWSRIDFANTIKILTKFGNACFSFVALKLVEVTYKLLDSRLLVAEKVDSRAAGAQNAFNRLSKYPQDFLELAEKLVDPDKIKLIVKGPKFLDSTTRVTRCAKLQIVVLHSDEGFQIGQFKTAQKELPLAIVDLDEEFQNKINGRLLKDYAMTPHKELGSRVLVSQADANRVEGHDLPIISLPIKTNQASVNQ